MDYKEKWIINFLNSLYIVGDDVFYDKSSGEVAWGVDILRQVQTTFGFSKDLVNKTVQNWGEANGIRDWEKARGRELNQNWSQDIIRSTFELSETITDFGTTMEMAQRNITEMARQFGENASIENVNYITEPTHYGTRKIILEATVKHTGENVVQSRGQDNQAPHTSWMEEDGYGYIP